MVTPFPSASTSEGDLMPAYLSKSPGIGGILKAAPQDFLVEEIAPDGTVFGLGFRVSRPDEPGDFVHFILQKRNWTTASAISEIAHRLHKSQRDFNVAGIKDKVAITTQVASVKGVQKEQLASLSIRDISINGIWTAKDRVHMGGLLGNRFTITVRDMEVDNAPERSEAIRAELNDQTPNYFGEQRFGSTRKNTHLIGQKLLQGDLEGALIMFLCDSRGEKNGFAAAARKELAASRDFQAALKTFPKNLRLERSVIDYLAKHPDIYANAFRRLPRNILLLFIHAFQAHLFNRLLSDRISEGEIELEEGEYFCGETFGFPDVSRMEGEGWICGKIIGYGTPLNGRERELLEELEIEKEAFKMKALPEIRSRGTYRTLLAPLKDFNSAGNRFRFSLPAGSYATVAMREFVDRKR
jgi:tRNA pseudouridine13 synthase